MGGAGDLGELDLAPPFHAQHYPPLSRKKGGVLDNLTGRGRGRDRCWVKPDELTLRFLSGCSGQSKLRRKRIMDRITETLLKEFVSTQGLESLSEAQRFENFANYSVLFDELSDTFELDDVAVGQDSNIGIDGLAVIVNGAHVLTEEDADSLIDANSFLDADFVFIQAKSSANFDLGEIGKVFFAVADFFVDKPRLSHTTATKDLMRLKDHIYSRSGDMANRTPNVSIFYVCTGKWTDDPALQARIDLGKTELMQTQLFHEVAFTPVDASGLQKLYRATKGKSSAKFSFSARVALPQQVNAVSEAHFGVIPAKEFLNLILDGNGNIKKSLFYDNVRDFQDFNKVNKDIRATLQSPEKFPLPASEQRNYNHRGNGQADREHLPYRGLPNRQRLPDEPCPLPREGEPHG